MLAAVFWEKLGINFAQFILLQELQLSLSHSKKKLDEKCILSKLIQRVKEEGNANVFI